MSSLYTEPGADRFTRVRELLAGRVTVELMQPIQADPTSSGLVVESIAALVWWSVGSVALPAGVATLVLAAGIAAAVALVLVGRRRESYGAAPAGPVRRRLVRLTVLEVVLVVAAVLGVGALGYGELAAPVACAVVGAHYLQLAGILDRRGHLALGAALMVLGACGALLALRSAGTLYPQGLVGLGGGALIGLAVALRIGLHDALRARISR